MDRKIPIYGYKETRVDLQPSSQGSTVAIRLPTHGTSIFPSRTALKRSHVIEFPAAEDEEIFRQRHLATASSIYHRAHHGSPRSILWRVLENSRVLSLQAVDISKDTLKHKKHAPAANSTITLRLNFPNPILPSCIAFSDSREHDTLSVFVLTDNYHLYTLTLRPEHFQKSEASDGNVGDWCKTYLSSAFSFKHPHRLVALSADELLISLIDGGLLKLTRKSGGDGTEWREVFYNEGGWSHSLRSLISFQSNNTVSYGKHNIDLSAVISIASPILPIRGLPFAFTVSLDHRIRVWNLNSGKLVYMKDMLTGELDLNDIAKKVIDPSLSQLVKVFGTEEYPLVVTYSPLGTGQFKFWSPKPQSDGSLEMEDLFQGITLQPRTPSSELWTLADFSVVVEKASMPRYLIWILWKNNTSYRVQSLHFTTGSSARAAWRDGWQSMACETIRDTPQPISFAGESLDVSDKWLEFLLAPGKYTTSTIETALAILETNSGSVRKGTRKSESLPERMCNVVASTTTLGRASDGSMDYDQLRAALEQQWLRFYRLMQELDKQRGEAQSLAIDPQGDLPCIVLTDSIVVVRACSPLERLWHNPRAIPDADLPVAAPIIAASHFRDIVPEGFLHNCRSMLLGELFSEPSLTDPARMRAFYERCGFEYQIDDYSFTQLVDKLKECDSEWKDLTPIVFDAMLDLLAPSEGRGEELPVSSFGHRAIMRATQEIVDLHYRICLDQIILIVLIEAEINHSEDGIQFESAQIFSKLVAILQRLELIHWLVSTRIHVPHYEEISIGATAEKPQQHQQNETVSVFEGVLRHLFTLSKRSMSVSVTDLVLQICAPDSKYEVHPATIQCFLLKHNRPDLAMDFARFVGEDPFSMYIQGRTCLASNDALTASALFKRAAFGISHPDPKKHTKFGSSGYFTNERDFLNAGLSKYYSHIVALYEREKNYSLVADFARLSLQFINPKDDDYNLRSDMHNRLFTAAINICRFETAYVSLLQFTDQTLQSRALRTLVTKMCEQSFASELIQFPFIGLHDQVDDVLADKCAVIVDVLVGVPYHQILYAWRIKRNDFRGAAAISLSRLQRLIIAGKGDGPINDDSLETPITQQYVTLINALSCVDPAQAWILNEAPPRKGAPSKNTIQPKRKVVTLQEVRKEYQAELDRIAAIENNQFAFGEVDEMDVL